MNRILLTVLSGSLFAAVSLAQNSNPLPTNGTAAQPQTSSPQGSQQIPDPSQSQTQPAAQPSTPQTAGPAGAAADGSNHAKKIAPGSVIPVQLTKTVDAKKAKTGDEVVAKVTMDMKTNSGDVLVPKDTKVIGHVTESQPKSKEQKESQMGIAFDRAVMKDGNEMNLPMSIQAVIGQQNNDANAAGGSDQGNAAPSGGAPAAGNAGRPGGMGGSTPPPSASPSAGDTSASNNQQQTKGGMPPITGQTTGVIGIPHLTLSGASTGTQGSVLTSDKNNVKLESGTMLLLKVNQ